MAAHSFALLHFYVKFLESYAKFLEFNFLTFHHLINKVNGDLGDNSFFVDER